MGGRKGEKVKKKKKRRSVFLTLLPTPTLHSDAEMVRRLSVNGSVGWELVSFISKGWLGDPDLLVETALD